MLNRVSTTAETEAVLFSSTKHILHRDYETRSQAILKTVGTHKYATHSSTTVLCCAFAIDDEPVQLWTPDNPVPAEFIEAATNPSWIVCAHGAHFEDAIERHVLHPRFNWPTFPIAKQHCTMAAALAAGLPARLGTVADALDLTNRKDRGGERLMHQLSKPRRARKGEDADQVHWFDDDDRLQRLYEYCRQDVEVERELYGRLPPLSASEQALWELSSRINLRGFCVDGAFAEAARTIAKAAAPEIDAEIAELTAGDVTSINQIAKLQTWLQQHGCIMEKLDRKAIEKKLLDPELVPAVQQVLELRLGGAQAAVKKLDALLARAGDDDRVRGAFRFHGASTGRWAGEGFQPQNLKRPLVTDVNAAVSAVSTGDYAHVCSLYQNPLSVVGDRTRPHADRSLLRRHREPGLGVGCRRAMEARRI